MDRGAASAGRPRDPRARRHDRGLRGGARPGRPRVDLGPGEGHAPRREGAHRGVRRPRGHRAHPQGDDQPGPDRERRADAGAPVAAARARPGRGHAGPPRRAGRPVRRPAAHRAQPQRRRPDHHAGQAVRLGRRGADRRLRPARGPDRALPPARDQGPGRHRPGHARPARRRREPAGRARAAGRGAPGLHRGAGLGRPGLPPLAGPRRALRARPGRCGTVEPGHDDPPDGRQRAGDRGVQGGPGRLLGDAAQDELALLRAGQRPDGDPARATPRWARSWPGRSGTRATSSARSCAGWRCPTPSSRSTACSRRSSRCSTSSARSRR